MRPGKSITRIAALLLSAACAMTAIAGIESTESTDVGLPAAPSRLSATGLYDSQNEIDSRNLPFVPQYPLWTDGAAKRRWIRLPEGAKIDVSDIDAWNFPVGTKLWKEFSWSGQRIETRMIWKAADDNWVFAAYRWDEDQTDAVLVPDAGIANVVEIGRGKRHSIPAIEDCHACHRSSPSVVLGFNALQLSDDRDPLAPHAEALPVDALTLRTLVKTNRLSPPSAHLASAPPRIRESDPVARAALGYLSANCGGCHNDRGPLARLGLVLSHDAVRDGMPGIPEPEPARATAIDASGRYAVPGLSEDASRIVAPGAPDRSALLHRMRSRRPSSQMPPLGSVIADTVAADLVKRWIESLDAKALDR